MVYGSHVSLLMIYGRVTLVHVINDIWYGHISPLMSHVSPLMIYGRVTLVY